MHSKPTEQASYLHEEEMGKDCLSPTPAPEPASASATDAVGVAGVRESSHHKSRAERRLVLKQDFIIIPLLSMGYFFGYLDRGQIGNAKLMGMPKALHLTAQEYYNVLMIFFVGFFVAELPTALLMRVISPRFVFGGALVLFGVCATCMSVAGGYAGLMVLRTLLGVGEATSTLAFLYASYWYRPDELALRNGILYCSTPFAGFASGLIAYGVAKHLSGVHGYAGWQWLFIVEGIPTIALGIVVMLVLPNFPEVVARKGHFLFKRPQEHQLVLDRLYAGQNTANPKISPKQILAGLKDPKTYLGSLMVAAPALGITAFTLFLPTFVREFGFSALDSQLYSIIPYSFAIVSTPLLCFLSDRLRSKALPMLSCLILSIIGFILLLATPPTHTVTLMAACCIVAAGAYPAVGIGASWVTSIHGGYTKRSTAFAVSMVFVQGYSIVGTQVYDGPPRFFKGHAVLLGLYVVALVATAVLWVWLRGENQRRDAVAAARGAAEEKVEDEGGRSLAIAQEGASFEELYDFHPDWRYPV